MSARAPGEVILAVSGSIAAYKACDVASELSQSGHRVTVVMTRAATRIVTPHAFHALTGNPVYTRVFEAQQALRCAHIALADRADVFAVAPATADVIAKLAHGIADDFLTTLALALPNDLPRILCPAMNHRMYRHPLVQKNVATLIDLGFVLVAPEEGNLACGHVGVGRLAEPAQIVAAIERALDGRPARPPRPPAAPIET